MTLRLVFCLESSKMVYCLLFSISMLHVAHFKFQTWKHLRVSLIGDVVVVMLCAWETLSIDVFNYLAKCITNNARVKPIIPSVFLTRKPRQKNTVDNWLNACQQGNLYGNANHKEVSICIWNYNAQQIRSKLVKIRWNKLKQWHWLTTRRQRSIIIRMHCAVGR